MSHLARPTHADESDPHLLSIHGGSVAGHAHAVKELRNVAVECEKDTRLLC